MVTTHLRTRAAQAGALLAVLVGGIAAAPAVAFASPPNVQITNLNTEVVSGGTVTLQYSVADTNGGGPGGGNGQGAQIQVSTNGMNCNGDCGQIAQVGQNGKQFNARLSAPNVDAGQSKQFQIQVTATINGESNNATSTVTVKGPDKPQTVSKVSGTVKDQDGKAVSGAAVAMQDSAGQVYSTNTSGSGKYSFTSTDSKPIAPGNISVGALKDGYEKATVQRQAEAGRSVNVPLTLKLIAASPSASPSASASASASAEPSDEASEEPTTPAETTSPPADTSNTASDQDSGGSMMFIIIGALLVAAGVGAIVLVWLRRKNGGSDDGNDDDPTVLPGGGGGAVPASQGRFSDATRVGAPVGAGHDATMVAPLSGAPAISDAPTMIHRPVVEDEFPDPYGAPIPQQGGYLGNGAAAGGWDDSQGGYGGAQQPYGGGNAYGDSTQYGGRPDDGYAAGNYGNTTGAAYGGGQPEQPRRYDEATGMYRPEADEAGYGGYGQQGAVPPQQGGTQQYGGGGYQPGAGYAAEEPAEQGGYGSWGAPDNGHNAYGPQPSQQHGGQPYGGGYDDAQNGYGQQGAGYDQQHGGPQQYGQQGGPRYDDDPDEGYDPRRGYGGQPPRR